MTQDELKAAVGQAATVYVQPGSVIGVGTGSTVNFFIESLAAMSGRVSAVVSSSEESTRRLRERGITVVDANEVESLAVYIDGADEIDHSGCMIKGGGGALTREKIVADMAERFICIADQSKLVRTLGRYPLPVEVIPMARSLVSRRLRALGGEPVLREGYLTDNACCILDVHGLAIADPAGTEREVSQWPGVVAVGVFARNRASVCLLGTPSGVRTLNF